MTTAPLTPDQRDLLEQKLRQQLHDLGGDLHAEREDERESVNSLHEFGVPDKGEESAANSVVEVERAIIRQHERERSQVQAALERLREERYGECMQCGSAIGAGRLMIEPAASRCLPCQEKYEEAG